MEPHLCIDNGFWGPLESILSSHAQNHVVVAIIIITIITNKSERRLEMRSREEIQDRDDLFRGHVGRGHLRLVEDKQG